VQDGVEVVATATVVARHVAHVGVQVVVNDDHVQAALTLFCACVLCVMMAVAIVIENSQHDRGRRMTTDSAVAGKPMMQHCHSVGQTFCVNKYIGVQYT
jgi:uncharacterized membrane protein